MLKFAAIERQIKFNKTNGINEKITGGLCLREPEPVSINDQVRLMHKEGAVLDKRLTDRLNNDFKKKHIAISVNRIFADRILRCGKKRRAQNIVGAAISKLRASGENRPSMLFRKALEIVHTHVFVRIYKKGRKTIYIPYLMRPEAAYNKSARTILNASRNSERFEKGMAERLAAEVQSANRLTGIAVESKQALETLVSQNYYAYRQIRPFRRKRGEFRK